MIATNDTGQQLEQEIKNGQPWVRLPQISGITRQGTRETTEDCWLSLQTNSPEGQITCVAVFDGVGGMAGGQDASRAAAGSVQESFRLHGLGGCADGPAWMQMALTAAAFSVATAGLGATTAAVGLVNGTELTLGWIGDSRACIVSADRARLRWLTADHHEMTEWGVAALAKWLGRCGDPGQPLHVPGIVHAQLEPGELLMLTTDGVHGTLDEQGLIGILPSCDEAGMLEKTSELICDTAIARGSTDNCTCLLLATDPHNLDSEEVPDE